jgi:hypothetical protein
MLFAQLLKSLCRNQMNFYLQGKRTGVQNGPSWWLKWRSKTLVKKAYRFARNMHSNAEAHLQHLTIGNKRSNMVTDRVFLRRRTSITMFRMLLLQNDTETLRR